MLNRKSQEPEVCSHLRRSLRQKGLSRSGARSVARFVPLALCLFFVASCRMDMQDQPKYKPYRASGFFKDGISSRQLPEGSVARGQLRDDMALYTGKRDKNQGAGNAQGQGSGGGGGNANNAGANAGGASGGGNNNGAGGSGGGSTSGGSAGGGSGRAASSAANAYPDDVDTFPFPVTPQLVNRGQERYQIFCSMCHGLSGYGDGMIVRRGYRKPPSYYDDNLRKAPVGHYFDVITKGWGAMPSYAEQIPVQDRWAIIAYIRALQLTVPAGQPQQQQGGNAAAGQATPTAAQPAHSQTQQSGGQR